MRRFLFMVVMLVILGFGWSFLKDEGYTEAISNVYEKVKEDFHTFIESDEVEDLSTAIIGTIQSWFREKTPDAPPLQMAELDENRVPPTDQTFSISGIELGDTKSSVEEMVGEPKRVSYNEYGYHWFTYHQNYQNFIKIMYNEENQVVGLYTNQDTISSTNHVQLGTERVAVKLELGEPLTKIQKGFVFYELPKDADYEIYLIDESYVTIFYDIHEQNTVTSMQIIDQQIENGRNDFYTPASEELKEGFETQMFDLTNATRVKHGLNILSWDEKARGTARKHSLDMAENNYFDHTNLLGQSPFDRMLEDQIAFTVAGENLAYGQFSSIFAHEGLMNSLGHRENILKGEFEFLGVGVAFNDESHPYYTQNYFTN